MGKNFIKYTLITFLIVFQAMLSFGHRDTTILVKFNDDILPRIPLDSMSNNTFSSLNSLDSLLIIYNTILFQPAYSINVINQDLKSYYALNIDSIISNFISDLENLNITSKIVTILSDSIALDEEGLMSIKGQANAKVDGNIAMYPNPAGDNVILEILEANSVTNIHIYDISGRQVYHSQWKKGEDKHTINTSEWQEGVYYVTLQTGEGEKTVRKLMIVR